jgi:GNAT superfamily N-acetyltransferase
MATPDSVLTFEVQDNPPAEDARVVDTGLGEANKLAAPIDGVKPLACFARTEAGAVIGGAVGRTWGECCELQQLWVARAHRLHGVGSRLVRMFEARGRERGCRTFYLDTFSFQALSFYQSLGYRAAHEIRGFPDGIVKYLMVRNVASDES